VTRASNQVILQSLQAWSVIRFKDIAHDRKAPPHFYFAISIKPGTLFLLCIITSRVEKRLFYYQGINPKAAQSLVRLETGSLPFLTKESLADCNSAELLSSEEILSRVSPEKGLAVECREIPSGLKQRVTAAILNSPLVTPAIKKLLSKTSLGNNNL